MSQAGDNAGADRYPSTRNDDGLERSFEPKVRNETARVTWPSRKEVYATTVVVILTSVFFGVYLWGVDLLLTQIVNWIYRTLGAA